MPRAPFLIVHLQLLLKENKINCTEVVSNAGSPTTFQAEGWIFYNKEKNAVCMDFWHLGAFCN